VWEHISQVEQGQCRHVGRVALRVTGSFNIQTINGTVQGISHKYCKTIQRNDDFKHEPRGLNARSYPAPS
jgi:hypothetical protein